MTSKNIAIIVGSFPTLSETFIVNQINSLIESGHSVTLYSYKKGLTIKIHDSLKKHDLLNKVIYFKKAPKLKISRVFTFLIWVYQHIKNIKWNLLFKTLSFSKYGKEAYTLKLFFETQWFLLPTNYDIIHVHFGSNARRIAYIKSLGFIPQKSKLITTFHGYGLMPNKVEDYKKEYACIFKETDFFTVNSEYLKGLLLEVNYNLKNIEIVPVGLDTSYFKSNSKKNDTSFFDIIFCGRLIELKGPDIAVDIIFELHKLGFNQLRLHIIGEGRLRPYLEEKIKILGLKDTVTLYGSLTQDLIKQQLEQADVFLLPGRYEPLTGRAETQGLVIQEAQSMGLPVVVSDVGGMKYGLIPNETGFVVEENNIQGFVSAIERLILDEKLKNEMGDKGIEFVRNNFDASVLLKRILFVYNETFKLV